MSAPKRIRLSRTKKSYACSFCNKIIEEPMKLPCEISICNEHIKHLKGSLFDCHSCKQQHVVPQKGFEKDEELQKQIDSNLYLTKAEFGQKKSITDLFEKIRDSFDDFNSKFNEFEYFTHEYFADIEKEIELRRERLKIQIDDISEEMIRQVKNKKAKFVEKSHEIRIDELKNGMEQEKRNLLENFRNLDITIKTINDLKANTEKKLKDIQDKIEMFSSLKLDIKKFSFGPAGELNQKDFGSFIKKFDFLVRVSDAGTCEIWNLETNSCVKKFKTKTNAEISGIANFKVINKNKLIVLYSNGMFGTFDLKSGECLKYFGENGAEYQYFDALFVNSTHTILILNKEINYYNHETGCLKKRLKVKNNIEHFDICFLFDNNNILCYDYNSDYSDRSKLKLVCFKTGNVTKFNCHERPIETFKVLLNEQTFATGTKGEIKIWDLHGKCIKKINLNASETASNLEFNGENKLMCVISSLYRLVYQQDLSDYDEDSSDSSYSSNSAISNSYKYIKVWDISKNFELITSIELDSGVRSIKTLSNDKTITIDDSDEDFLILRIWNTNSNKISNRLNKIKLSNSELSEDGSCATDGILGRFDENFCLCSFFD